MALVLLFESATEVPAQNSWLGTMLPFIAKSALTLLEIVRVVNEVSKQPPIFLAIKVTGTRLSFAPIRSKSRLNGAVDDVLTTLEPMNQV